MNGSDIFVQEEFYMKYVRKVVVLRMAGQVQQNFLLY